MSTTQSNRIDVMIATGSSLNIQLLSKAIATDKEIQIVDGVVDLFSLQSKVAQLKPKVVLLDTDIARFDISSQIADLISRYHVAIVVLSEVSPRGVENTIDLLQAGAVDFVAKSATNLVGVSPAMSVELIKKIKSVAGAKLDRLNFNMKRNLKTNFYFNDKDSVDLVVVGVTTFGIEILTKFLSIFPKNFVPIVVVIDLPSVFLRSLITRLKKYCQLEVKEIRNNDVIQKNNIYISSSGVHTKLELNASSQIIAKLKDGELISDHKPSIDVLFQSVPKICSKNAVGVLFGGIGSDGVYGLKSIKDAGGKTYVQDVESSVIEETSNMAVKIKAADVSIPMEDMAAVVLQNFNS